MRAAPLPRRRGHGPKLSTLHRRHPGWRPLLARHARRLHRLRMRNAGASRGKATGHAPAPPWTRRHTARAPGLRSASRPRRGARARPKRSARRRASSLPAGCSRRWPWDWQVYGDRQAVRGLRSGRSIVPGPGKLSGTSWGKAGSPSRTPLVRKALKVVSDTPHDGLLARAREPRNRARRVRCVSSRSTIKVAGV